MPRLDRQDRRPKPARPLGSTPASPGTSIRPQLAGVLARFCGVSERASEPEQILTGGGGGPFPPTLIACPWVQIYDFLPALQRGRQNSGLLGDSLGLHHTRHPRQ